MAKKEEFEGVIATEETKAEEKVEGAGEEKATAEKEEKKPAKKTTAKKTAKKETEKVTAETTEKEEAVKEVAEEVSTEETTEEEPAKEESPAKESKKAEKAPAKKKAVPKKKVKKIVPQQNPNLSREIITLDKDEVVEFLTKEEEELEIAWTDIMRSRMEKEPLTGILDDIDQISIGKGQTTELGVVNYHGIQVKIPLQEMNIVIERKNASGKIEVIADSSKERTTDLSRVMSSMQGAEIDFIVMEYDIESGIALASRRMAMEKKARTYYVDTHNGTRVITPGKVIQARIIAVAEGTYVRLECFGVETFVKCLDLDPQWIASARDAYEVGEKLYVVVKDVSFANGRVSIEVEGRSLKKEDNFECKPQARYLAEVTSKAKGKYYLRLKAGCNAISYQYVGEKPYPQVGDEVKLVCSRFDKENKLCIGTIIKVVKHKK